MDKLHIEVVLLVFDCFLLEDLRDENRELLGLVRVVAHLLLHVPAHFLPFTQSEIVAECKFGNQRFDADVERGQLDLSQIPILDEAPSEVPQVIGLDAVLVVLLSRGVSVNIHLLVVVTADLFLHIVDTRLVDHLTVHRGLDAFADVARGEAQLGFFGKLVRIDFRMDTFVWTHGRLIFLSFHILTPRVLGAVPGSLEVDSLLLLGVVVLALAWDAAVAPPGLLS